MIINPTMWKIITSQTAVGNKRAAITNRVRLWPGGIVPYTINNQLGKEESDYPFRMSKVKLKPSKLRMLFVI